MGGERSSARPPTPSLITSLLSWGRFVGSEANLLQNSNDKIVSTSNLKLVARPDISQDKVVLGRCGRKERSSASSHRPIEPNLSYVKYKVREGGSGASLLPPSRTLFHHVNKKLVGGVGARPRRRLPLSDQLSLVYVK